MLHQPPVQRRVLRILLIASVAMASGCSALLAQFGSGRRQSASGQTENSSAAMDPSRRSTARLDQAVVELDAAKASLADEKWDEAIEQSQLPRELLKQNEGYGSSDDRARHNTVMAESIVVEGLAYRGKGDPLAAVFALNDRFDPGRCSDAMRGQCQEHYDFLFENETYRKLTTRTDYNYGRTVEYGHVVPFYTSTLGHTSITTSELAALPNYYTKDADYLAIWVTTSFATSLKVKRNGNAHSFALKGKSYKDAWKSCNDKIGELEISGARFDIMRCKRITHDYKAGTLKFTLSPEEAEKVALDKQRALIAFRRKNFRKQGGSTWTLGGARLVMVEDYE